jgi:hypothetical protein
MPYFSVMLHGEEINIPSEDGEDAIIGFYTTRLVKAETRQEAEIKAKEMITKEWSTGPYAMSNKGSLPKLRIETITDKTFFDSLRVKNKGYAFYNHDD